MAVVIVAGATGSPGITTTSLGLALTWPSGVVLADCDRQPSHSILSGYLRGVELGGRGLHRLAGLHREHRNLGADLWHQTVPLTEGTAVTRRLLPGFPAPSGAQVFDPVWPNLADALAELDDKGVDVVVDAGRIGVTGIPLALLARADAIAIVTGSSLRMLGGLRLYLPVLRDELDQLPSARPVGVVVVGPGRPYTEREIQHHLGIPVWGTLPHEPVDAAVLSDGAEPTRRFNSGALMSGMRSLALTLSERLSARGALRVREAVHVQ